MRDCAAAMAAASPARQVEGFPMLGHGGGIDGFASMYGYSTSRDVGYVVLLNSTHSPEAMRRISEAGRPLSQGRRRAAAKAAGDGRRINASRSTRATITTPTRATRRSRSSNGCCPGGASRVSGDHLEVKPAFGRSTTLDPGVDALFRFEDDVEATRVFAENDAGADGDGRRVAATRSGSRAGASRASAGRC